MITHIYPVVNHFHSAVRWLILTCLLISLILASYNIIHKKEMNLTGRLFSRFTVYFAHIQFLVGIVLYLISPKVVFRAESMDNPILRFFLLEHITAMAISVACITMGYNLMKKALGTPQSARKIFWFYLIGLVIILAMIPWPFMSYGSHWI